MSFMKKINKLLLGAVFLGVFTFGTAGTIFEVNTDDEIANLREKASSKSKVLVKLDDEESGEIIRKEGNWYYVKYKMESGENVYGYIHNSQIVVGETYITSSKDGYVNVRNDASSSSDILEELPNGVKIVKYYQKGEWYYVKFPVHDGGALSEDYGYIHKSQLNKIK